MNILISGIHGFVGSNFIRALKDKHTLYGLDIVSPAKEGVVTTFSWQDFEPTSFRSCSLLFDHYDSENSLSNKCCC
jgi:nucleoside-diphosphate-sugar epimerase